MLYISTETRKLEDFVPMNSILLRKDQKHICHARCPDPPAKLPLEWNISTILSKRKFDISGLPELSLQPDPKCVRDREEWGRFLSFLHKHDMIEWYDSKPTLDEVSTSFMNFHPVATAVFEQDRFYILPPVEASTSSLVRVAYNMPKAFSVDNHLKDRESGSHLAEGNGGSEPVVTRGPASAANLCPPSSAHKFSQVQDGVCNSTAELCSKSHSHEVKDSLSQKNYVRVNPSYLRTLGQAHSGWIFGGIAELVDNSRDAKATKMDIFIDMIKLKNSGKDEPMLSFIDDGHGMGYEEILKMVSFGHKQPVGDVPDRIGRFGVGFKTGAMRLGSDALVLTQTTNSRCIAFLSQALNEGKENIEIPIVSYHRYGQRMEVDTNVHPEALAKYNLKAIQEFSPFNKYLIGEKAALFSGGTGTQIYIWNLDKWGSDYCLQWCNGLKGGSSFHQGDIFIRSRRIRSRLGQISHKVPLDYSLRSYLELIFLVPRMKISVQHAPVRSRPLGNFLTKTVIENDCILGKRVHLTLGFSQLEWEQANSGIFLYWHGRLIEAYKRVGGMVHNADVCRGVIGVIDVTDLMDDGDGRVWVHNNKQGFQDCEAYAHLELWLGKKADEYWDNNFDSLKLDKDNCLYKPDLEWVQCDKCRKWRMLPPDFDARMLPPQWFCYMEPLKGQCAAPEQKMESGVVTISTKRSGYDCMKNGPYCGKLDVMKDSDASGDNLAKSEDAKRPALKRLRKGIPTAAEVK
ncbi:MORC family CW-type zinc finger protein 4-like isoform X1 [Senna tora]|uniref:MORC family CW-type zinc finger protein 4-like isoform X1 n=1 Tax=Senna tora TaxID=362788 RepID=A0A834TV47_9FABA|nr:MORC family CW-type zinc finger protein 4-like isoform X1 [Senna tora]